VTSGVQDEVSRIDKVVTTFLDEWTARTKRRHAIGNRLNELNQIVSPEATHEGDIPSRLGHLESWLSENGTLVNQPGVQRSDLEHLVTAAEKLVQLREKSDPTEGARSRSDALLDQLVNVIRSGSSRLGLQYTPAGLVEAPRDQVQESRRARQSLLNRLGGFDDVKVEYRKALEFQLERLAYFYQDDTHLLSVLDYQLKNLEARPSDEDEFFAACLIYFLKQHNYQVAPYVKRFRQVLSAAGSTAASEEMSL
jgi:hypothetical protein